ncbi:hypothetical protein PQX77_012906 [Marasmius sp. AFHP31]|nr:hypothetical protein PQX77_012906 [Marasmius sp. AFHP31]
MSKRTRSQGTGTKGTGTQGAGTGNYARPLPREPLTLGQAAEWQEQPRTSDPDSFDQESLPADLVHQRLHRLHPAELLNDYLEIQTVEDEEAESLNTVFELPRSKPTGGYIRYENTLKNHAVPCQDAKSLERRSRQKKLETAIYDGTYVDGGPFTAAQPIEIFYPPFADLKQKLHDPAFKPDLAILDQIHSLMNVASLITTEAKFRWQLLPKLQDILEHHIADILSEDGYHPDGMMFTEIDQCMIPLLIWQIKKALGEGGCDVTAQVIYSALEKWQDGRLARFRERCPCPTLLLINAGSHSTVLGVIWADRFIVQRLSDIGFLGYDSFCHDDQIHNIACLFTVLRGFLNDLKQYYHGLDLNNIRPLQRHLPHPRFFPQCLRYFCRERKTLITIEYVRAIDDDECTNLAYVAKDADGREVLVKFFDRCGYEAHQLLADADCAPTLYYVGLVDGEHDVSHSEEARGTMLPFGLYKGPIRMNVMEYLKGKHAGDMPRDQWPTDAHAQLKDAVGLLHAQGYVFGDLRHPNVIFSPRSSADGPPSPAGSSHNYKAKLIDLDWSGKEEDVYYPAGLSTIARWTEGVESFKQIKKEHDLAMLDRHFG